MKTNKGIVHLFLLVIVIFVAIGAVGYLAYQNAQLKNELATQPQPTSIPSESKETTEPKVIEPQEKSFNYINFSLRYPSDWVLSDMSQDEEFPLKERLQPLYGSGKVIALNKEGIYVIITIGKDDGSGAGGIFINEADYNEFINNKDKVIIGNSTFYLRRNHLKIDSLIKAHSGPYGWGALPEYLPDKLSPPGEHGGYEDVIKRNGYLYNFIIVSEEDGIISPNIQEEIISFLETIEW